MRHRALILTTRSLSVLVLATCLASSPGVADEKSPAERLLADATPVSKPALPKALLKDMPWRSIGPGSMGGRITALSVYEKRPSTWWAATAGGGLIKTTDNGISFEHQFDHEAVASVGDVAVCQADPNIVWVGTGEGNPRNSVSWGKGVYKSLDGGKTWKYMGLGETFQISSVRIHPTNPDVVYVGALGRLWGPNEERGLFKTTDGGTTWSKIHYVNAKTGVVDVQMHPTDPETLLVATYERQRDMFCTNDPAKKWGKGSGLYKTTNGGKSFKKLTQGLPSGTLGRIGIDYWRKDPSHVYVVLESDTLGLAPPNAAFMGVNGSDADAGARLTRITKGGPAGKAGFKKDDIVLAVDGVTVHSWTELVKRLRQHVAGDKITIEISRARKSVEIEFALGKRPTSKKKPQAKQNPRAPRGAYGAFLGGQVANAQDDQGKAGHEYGGIYHSADGGESWKRINSLNPRPMYFSEIRVDPQDRERIWVLGVRLWRSKDGGKSFKPDGHPRDVHVDHHALWIDSTNGRHVILGNDGGLYVSYDGGGKYDHLNRVAIGQFYDVGVGPRRDYRVYGGLQDNGSWGGPNRVAHGSGPSNEDWIRIGGGDGFRVRVDPEDPEQIYFESQNGNVGQRHLGTGARGMMRPRPAKGERYRFNWYTPFILSHHNSRIYYTAGNKVFRSLNRGRGMRAISPDITATKRGSATALAESPRDSNVLYVGTDDGGFWSTRDGGHTWVDLYALSVPREPRGKRPPVASPATSDSSRDDGDGASDAKEGDATAPDPKATPKSRAKKKAGRKPTPKPGPTLSQAQPDRRYVSWIEPSRHAAKRVYVVFDGHRSDDGRALVFASEDQGGSWRSLTANLPAKAGTTRVLREDLVNENVLYLGTEFGAWVSIDRGATWTSLNTNLPTVAVHQFAQHPTTGDLVAATHGRSLWVLDVTTLRQMSAKGPAAEATLYRPAEAVQWRPQPSRGRARGFVGSNPPSGAQIFYRLKSKVAKATVEIHGLDGTVLRTLEARAAAGLHRLTWDLRAERKGRRRSGRRLGAGSYKVVLIVGEGRLTQDLVIARDPGHRDTTWMAFQDAEDVARAAAADAEAAHERARRLGRDE